MVQNSPHMSPHLHQKRKKRIFTFRIFVLAVGLLITLSHLFVTTVAATDQVTAQPLTATIETTSSVQSTSTSYTMNVLVLSYFPVTSNGKNIDTAVTGDWGETYKTTLQKTRVQTKQLEATIEKSTRYLGYKNTKAPVALNYNILSVKEYKKAVPMRTDGSRKPNYSKILLDHDICTLVQTKGLKEVWIWAYQGPTYPGTSVPYLNISESKMSGPYGDISNSDEENDMPQCGKTYRVYVFNYQRGATEALHSWAHQLEAEMEAVDFTLFRTKWQGEPAENKQRTTRCGDAHFPPNATEEYGYDSKIPYQSDCLDWKPTGQGTVTSISCKNWGCENLSDADNSELKYLIWNMQNMPGINNTKTFNGVPLRNWWDVHGDFDTVMGTSKRLTL